METKRRTVVHPKAPVVPLITKGEFKDLWEMLTTLLDAGAYEDDLATVAKYQRLQEKLAFKAGIRLEPRKQSKM